MGQSIKRLSNWMESVHTEQELHSAIIMNISIWIFSSALLTASHICPIQNQLKSGWAHLMQGRLHKTFSAYMENHFRSINSKMKGRTWRALFIQKIWTYLFNEQWEARNKIVHVLDKTAKSKREHQNLNFDIKKWYDQESSNRLLHSDLYLMENL